MHTHIYTHIHTNTRTQCQQSFFLANVLDQCTFPKWACRSIQSNNLFSSRRWSAKHFFFLCLLPGEGISSPELSRVTEITQGLMRLNLDLTQHQLGCPISPCPWVNGFTSVNWKNWSRNSTWSRGVEVGTEWNNVENRLGVPGPEGAC